MSDENKFIDPIHAQIEEKALLEKRKTDLQAKELIVRERRVENSINQISESDKNAEIAKKTNYGMLTEEEIQNKQKENTLYMKAAKKKMKFINDAFNMAVPFFRKNIILIGGKTGEGKSTAVANIIREIVRHTNPDTGKRLKALVLSNEEKSEDVYNRVTCLIKGWPYTNHDKFTEEQVEVFNQYIKGLSSMITVVDDNFGGASGTTTTLEGICQVFDNLIANNQHYDVIILDYYQNCKESRKNPHMNEWEVQSALARKLDQYKNIYPAPIIVFAQVAQTEDDRRIPFKTRIEGRKVILNVCTCCLEMVANRKELTTEWWIHKSRFNESVGEKIITGYDKGSYVLYDDRFREKVAQIKAARESSDLNKQIAPMVVEPEEVESE
jgi:replicative DNA helicase